MATIRIPDKVQLIVGILISDLENLNKVYSEMETLWGKMDYKSPFLPFDQSHYYEKEMGETLHRQWVSFEKLIDRSELASKKLDSNNIESKWVNEKGNRKINLDPGYIASEHLILASCKGFSHRVYLRDGVHAEVTLLFCQGKFQTLPWTYPDYANNKEIFMEIRKIYRKKEPQFRN